MFGKGSDNDSALHRRIAALERRIAELQNQNTHLVYSARRWAKKFSSPMYRVPEQVIKQMQEEAEQYKANARVKYDHVVAQNAVLTKRILDLTEEKSSDLFGTAAGNEEVTFEMATSHIRAQPLPEDEKVVDLMLNDEWAKRMSKHAQNGGGKGNE